MASKNLCIFAGNLGKDPEVRYLPNGDATCNLSIATTEKWKDKNTGEQKEKTEWIQLEFYGRLAEIAAQYLKKGAGILVEAKYTSRKYTDKDGVEKYAHGFKVHDMQMLGGKQEGQGGGQAAPAQQRPAAAPAGRPAPKPAPNFSDMSDDIPF